MGGDGDDLLRGDGGLTLAEVLPYATQVGQHVVFALPEADASVTLRGVLLTDLTDDHIL